MIELSLYSTRRAVNSMDERSQRAFDKIEGLAVALSEIVAGLPTRRPGALHLIETIRDEAADAMNMINSLAEEVGAQHRDDELPDTREDRLVTGRDGGRRRG
jgi:hypothetical protein